MPPLSFTRQRACGSSSRYPVGSAFPDLDILLTTLTFNNLQSSVHTITTLRRIRRPAVPRSSLAMTPQSQILLPPELMYQIFGYLTSDTASLKSSSLVCASWEPLTGPYLFKHLRINCKALTIARSSQEDDVPPTLEPAYRAIKGSSRIIMNTQSIALVDNDGYGEEPSKSWAGSLDHIPLRLIGDIISTFTALCDLRFVDLELTNGVDPRISHIAFSAPKERSLDKLDLQFVPQTFLHARLDQLLALFDGIGELTVVDRWRPGYSTQAQLQAGGTQNFIIDRPALSPPPYVRSVILRNRGDYELVAEVLTALSRKPRLRSSAARPTSLALHDHRAVASSAPVVNKYLVENADGLASFQCDLSSSSIIATATRAMTSEAGEYTNALR